MTPINFDAPVVRRNSDSLKWARYQGTTILPMWVADMDFAAPAEVLTALHERVDHGVFGYTVAPGELSTVIVARLLRLYGWQVTPEMLVWLPGLVSGLNIACRAVGRHGNGVVAMPPVYPPFLHAPANVGRHLVSVPLLQDDGQWRMDFALLERSLTPETRLVLFCHPHNPVGRAWSVAEMAELVAICRRHDCVVCSDEIHCELLLDQTVHTPLAMVDQRFSPQTITLMSPSKTFNLPGLGFSFAVIPDARLRRSFRRAMAGLVPEVNTFGYTAALAAYRHGDAWLTELLGYLEVNRDLVAAMATTAGLVMAPVQATYLAWLDVRGHRLPDPVAFFERRAGVGLSDGAEFGSPGFVRLNFGCRRALLQQALERMTAALAGR